MPVPTNFENFKAELARLVGNFEKNLRHHKSQGYVEAQLRDDFLNPFFRSLGWDIENRDGHIPKNREVEIESRTTIEGGHKRADYLFRTDGKDQFVCEAKKPAEELHGRYAFQAKRYAWNKNLPLAVLTDFEEIKIYVVGGKPHVDSPDVGLWKSYHFKQFPLIIHELWDLLAYEKVHSGSIDKLLECLPKKATGKGKVRQQWLIKPDRSRSLDNDFLTFLDEARRSLASDLINENNREDLLVDNRLNEATQHILDRLLFLRICEDRDIDTGVRLDSLLDVWQKNYAPESRRRRQESLNLKETSESPDGQKPGRRRGDESQILSSSGQSESPDVASYQIKAPKDALWHSVVRHFRALDRRPPSHVPFFNGNLFKRHFSEDLLVSDEWLADFIRELSTDESPYLFNVISVEILGTIYERFFGKVVRPHGRGVVIEEKPEVRKAGGVYYTPSYIVDYIVEQTLGKLLDEIVGDDERSPKSPLEKESQRLVTSSPTIKDLATRTNALRILDPACGSGSFLIRAYERVCEHWQRYFTRDLKQHLTGRRRGDESQIDSTSGSRRGNAAQISTLVGRGQGNESQTSSSSVQSETPHVVSYDRSGRSRGNETLNAEIGVWEKKHRKFCWVDLETRDVHLTVSLKREILTHNIYGVDLDGAAVEVTQLSLYLKMLENENRNTLARERELFGEEIALLPPLQDNIKCGNSLIASDFGGDNLFSNESAEELTRIRAFDWNVGFSKIIKGKDTGFDVVIGNPPYIRIQGFPSDQINYFSKQYRAATGNYDIYVNFVERGLSLLSPSGRFGMILPNKFFRTDYGIGLRKLLSDGCAVSQVVDFEASQVFEATTYTCLLFLQRTKSPTFAFGKSIADEKALQSIQFSTAGPETLGEAAWSFADKIQSALMEKMRAKGTRLLELPADMSRGSSSGDDEVFMVEEEGHELEEGILRIPIFASDFGRYFFAPSGKWKIIFPYIREDKGFRLMSAVELRRDFPKTFAYLQKNSDKLKERKQFAEWFGYSAPRNLDLHERAHIVVPLLAESGVFSFIPEKLRKKLCPMASGGFTITLGKDYSFFDVCNG